MPDLGNYATEVGIAYGASLFLIGALVLYVMVKARKTRATLHDIEARITRRG